MLQKQLVIGIPLVAIGSYMLEILGLVFLLIIANILAGIGLLIRQGVEIKKAIVKAKRELQEQGMSIDQQKCNELELKANLKIYGCTLSVLSVYAAIYIFSPQNFMPWLLCLFPISLGYCGIFFIPKVSSLFDNNQ